MADDAILISMPWGPDTVRGSKSVPCHDCDRELGVAPSGQRTMREQGAVAVCPACARARLALDPDPQVAPLTPEQFGEILGHLRRN